MRSKKTLLLAALAISVFLSACNKTTTQTQENFPSTEQNATTTQPKDTAKSVYYMTGGKMMMVKNGQVQSMTGDQTLNDGAVVKTNGEVVRKDGSKMMLKNGESITMDGSVVVESPYK